MPYIADLHIHSHFSMATSKHSDPEHIFRAAAAKGIDLVGTGDFTHPGWRRELLENLDFEPATSLWRLKPELEERVRRSLPGESRRADIRFVLSGEISSIYKKDGRARKVHNVILLPDMESVERLCAALEKIGNIRSDGRPILGLDCRDLLEMTLEASPRACFIPAHIWTPHFSVFGSKSGFDRMEDCYGDLTGEIYAVETGLSSDPPMNWRVSALDRFTLVSNSDAHSPEKLAREANLIQGELSYTGLIESLKSGNAEQFRGTIEFYPEEGKYHYDGHRACKVRLTPEQSAGLEGRCPACGGRITEGVLNRVAELADRPDGSRSPRARGFERLIPLAEVLAECHDSGPATRAVEQDRERLLKELGPELYVLREAPLDRISRCSGSLVAEAVRRNRSGEVRIDPGYDGEYGTVRIFEPGEKGLSSGQMFFFEDQEPERKSAPEMELPAPVVPEAVEKPEAVSFAGPEHFRLQELGLELNERQLEAVTAPSGPLAVLAGPGTGKTRCLAARAAWLVKARGVSPESILAVTFTNRAAREMSLRIAGLIEAGPEGAPGVKVCTFHGFCLELLGTLREETPVLADEADSLNILREALAGIEPLSRVREIYEAIGRAKAQGASPEDFRGAEDIRRAYSAYRDLCRKLKVLDFDDLILESLAELRRDPANLTAVRRRFGILLADEFQDISPAQYALVRCLAGETAGGLFVIGDPNQSIYGFRGADGRVFENLRRDYPELRQIRLEFGYRCPEIISSAAGALIGQSSPLSQAPRAVVRGGVKIRLIRAPGETAEAIAVVREIGRLVGGTEMLAAHGEPRGGKREELAEYYSFADCAVIARTGALLEGLEQAFVTAGIPCRLRGAKSFLRDPLVRGAVAWLRLLADPTDDLRFLEALRFAGLDPNDRYFGALRQSAASSGHALLAELQRVLSREIPQKKASAPAATFLLDLDRFRRLGRSGPAPLLEKLLERFVPAAGSGREALDLLLTQAGQFDSLPEFLSRLAVRAEGDIERPGRNTRERRAEAVTLLTMHAAKGLEFKAVFVCGVEEGLIPFTYRKTDPEEERRLLFVALTRASERLYLTSAAARAVRGKTVRADWSPLLADLPSALLEMLDLNLPARPPERQLELL